MPNIPTNIEKEAVQIMPAAVNMEKVTRMACNGEVHYSVDYGKLKTCGCCIEYLRKDLFKGSAICPLLCCCWKCCGSY